MGGGGHKPPAAEPEYMKLLANRSWFAPEGHHYPRELWTSTGGWWCDPKGWRGNTALVLGSVLGICYMSFRYCESIEVFTSPPTGWHLRMLWNDRIPRHNIRTEQPAHGHGHGSGEAHGDH